MENSSKIRLFELREARSRFLPSRYADLLSKKGKSSNRQAIAELLKSNLTKIGFEFAAFNPLLQQCETEVFNRAHLTFAPVRRRLTHMPNFGGGAHALPADFFRRRCGVPDATKTLFDALDPTFVTKDGQWEPSVWFIPLCLEIQIRFVIPRVVIASSSQTMKQARGLQANSARDCVASLAMTAWNSATSF